MPRIEFTRVLSLIDSASRFLEYKYGLPFDTGQVKGLDCILEKKDEYERYLNSEELSTEQIEKKLFYLFKDYIRSNSELFQKNISDEDGVVKRLWFSPYFNKLVFDEVEELGLVSSMADESPEDMKEMFYKHKHLFNLTDKEGLFIDLCFTGYNPYNEVDVLVFREALDTDSPRYVKTFFNRLCEKLKDKSMELGFR